MGKRTKINVLNKYSKNIFSCYTGKLLLYYPSNKAGLVKWYNNSFPNCGRESDSPIPHKLGKSMRSNNIIIL